MSTVTKRAYLKVLAGGGGAFMKHIKMFHSALAALVVLIGLPTELYGDWVYDGNKTITEVVKEEGAIPWKIYVAANGEGFLQLSTAASSVRWSQLGKNADGSTSVLNLNTPIRLVSDTSKEYKINKMMPSHFKDKTQIVDVILPDAMTAIPEYCFRGCANLTNIVIGANVSSIGKEAFISTSKLKCDLIFNAKAVTSIGSSAFFGCRARNIIFNGEIMQSDIPESAFRNLRVDVLKLSGMRNPSGLNSLIKYAFLDSVVNELWMPKRPSTIPDRALAFGNEAYSLVIFVDPNNEGWKSVCKRWNDLTDAQKAKWTRTDIKPIGLTTATPANQWLVEIPHKKGFYISIR